MTSPTPDQQSTAFEEQMERLRAMTPADPAALDAHRAEESGGAFKKLLAEAALPALTLGVIEGGGVSVEGPFAAWGARRDRLRAALAKPPALVVLGGPSSLGKTLMAVDAGVEFLKKGHRVRYVRLFDLMEIYDAARSHPPDAELEFSTEREVSLWLLQPALLLLDECDKVRESRYVLDKVFNAVEARREARRRTVFVGNWDMAGFKDWASMKGQVAHGPSLIHRLNREGGFMDFTRNEKAQTRSGESPGGSGGDQT